MPQDSSRSSGSVPAAPSVPLDRFDQAPERRMLRIDEVVVDAGTQVREEISEQVVEDYAESLGERAAFPPVVAFSDGLRCWLADGFSPVAGV